MILIRYTNGKFKYTNEKFKKIPRIFIENVA